MNKKILFGSIIAVVILVLVSFTGVVGYQTTSSTIARASPLFSVRSTRAINEDSKDLTCDYVGKGEESVLSIPKRDSETSRIQKAMYIISNMDDKAFSRFIMQIIFHLKYQEKMTSTEIIDVLQALHTIREKPNDINYYDTMNNPRDDTSEWISCRWSPGCFINSIITLILGLILIYLTITRMPLCYSIAYHNYSQYCPTVWCPL